MNKKMVHIAIDRSQFLGRGISIRVTDTYNGEELYKNSVWPGGGLDSQTCFGIAISYWRKMLDRFGPDIELDNSKATEITKDFLNAGLSPNKRHVAFIKKVALQYYIDICLDGYYSLPIYSNSISISFSNSEADIVRKFQLIIKRYENTRIDLSKASSLNQYFE